MLRKVLFFQMICGAPQLWLYLPEKKLALEGEHTPLTVKALVKLQPSPASLSRWGVCT